MHVKSNLPIVLKLLVALALVGGLIFLGLRACQSLICIPTTLHTQTSSGIRFSVIDVDCDALAKEEDVRVFAWTKDESKKTLLFRFDPIYGAEIPTISVDETGTITISIADVEQALEKIPQFEGHKVIFNVQRDRIAERWPLAYFYLHQATGLYEQYIAGRCPSGKEQAESLILHSYAYGSNAEMDAKRDQLFKWLLKPDASPVELESFRLSVHELQQRLGFPHEAKWHDEITAQCK